MYGEALEIAWRVLGKEHPTTLSLMDCLADFLESRAKLPEAKQLRDEKSQILRAQKEKAAANPDQ